jgi:tetratricopeptide (TPR) repeat protein
MPETLLSLQKALTRKKSAKERQPLLLAISKLYLRKENGKSLEFSKESADIAELLGDLASLIESIRIMTTAQYYLGRNEEVIESANRGIILCTESGNELSKSHFQRLLSLPFMIIGNYSEAQELLYSAYQIQKKYSAHHDIALTLHNTARLYLFISDWSQSFKCLEQAIEVLRIHPSPEMEMAIQSTIGSVYSEMDELDHSLEAYSKELELSRKYRSIFNEASALGNIGGIYLKMQRYDVAMENFQKALAIQLKQDNVLHIIASYHNIGQLLFEQGKLKEATEYLEKALEINFGNNQYLQIAALMLQGSILNKSGSFRKAIPLLESALNLIEKGGSLNDRWSIIQALSVSYEGLEDTAKALEYHKRYVEARIEFITKRSHRDLQIIENRFLLERLRFEKEALKKEIDLRVQEVTSLGLEALRKNELLQSLKKEVNVLYSSTGSDRKILRSVTKNIEEIINAERARELFDDSLAKLHEGFLHELKSIFPQLTKKELQICSLLKMNMSSHDIADFLFTSERTIEWHRMHIRKKFALPEKKELSEFLSEVAALPT